MIVLNLNPINHIIIQKTILIRDGQPIFFRIFDIIHYYNIALLKIYLYFDNFVGCTNLCQKTIANIRYYINIIVNHTIIIYFKYYDNNI